MRDVPQVQTRRTEEDNAHYAASVALDAVLEWFANDGYTVDELLALCEEHVDEIMNDGS